MEASRFGTIPLGGDAEEPEYSTGSWVSTMLATGMGIGLIFYGVGEPLYFYTLSPPDTVDPQTARAVSTALGTAMFHWTIYPWAMYALVGSACSLGLADLLDTLRRHVHRPHLARPHHPAVRHRCRLGLHRHGRALGERRDRSEPFHGRLLGRGHRWRGLSHAAAAPVANQVLVDSVTTAVTTANEPHEVETIELHTRLSSTAGNDDGDDEGAEDGTDETAKDLRGDGRAVDGADDASAGADGVRGTGPEDCSWCWGTGSLLGPQLLDGGAHLACRVIDDDDVAVG